MALTLITSVVVFELETLRNYQKKQRELILQNKAANQEKRKALERWQTFVDQTQKPKEEANHDDSSQKKQLEGLYHGGSNYGPRRGSDGL